MTDVPIIKKPVHWFALHERVKKALLDTATEGFYWTKESYAKSLAEQGKYTINRINTYSREIPICRSEE